jgi:hypothetical protein
MFHVSAGSSFNLIKFRGDTCTDKKQVMLAQLMFYVYLFTALPATCHGISQPAILSLNQSCKILQNRSRTCPQLDFELMAVVST